MTDAVPLDVDCPRCGRKVGWDCVTVNSEGQPTVYYAAPHSQRWKAVGIRKPDDDDRHRAYEDSNRRRAERIANHKPRDWREKLLGQA